MAMHFIGKQWRRGAHMTGNQIYRATLPLKVFPSQNGGMPVLYTTWNATNGLAKQPHIRIQHVHVLELPGTN